MAERNKRLTENQNLARYANRRLQDVAGRVAVDGKVIPFLCECADRDCRGSVEMTIDDYFIAHLDSDLYVVIPKHPRLDGEATVEDHGLYEIVSKAAA